MCYTPVCIFACISACTCVKEVYDMQYQGWGRKCWPKKKKKETLTSSAFGMITACYSIFVPLQRDNGMFICFIYYDSEDAITNNTVPSLFECFNMGGGAH